MCELWVIEVSFWGWGCLGASGCLERLPLCMLLFVLFSRTRKSLVEHVCTTTNVQGWMVSVPYVAQVHCCRDLDRCWRAVNNFGGLPGASEYLDTPSLCLLWYCILVSHSFLCFWFSLCVRHSVCVCVSIWACMSVFLCVSMNVCVLVKVWAWLQLPVPAPLFAHLLVINSLAPPTGTLACH